MTTFDPGNRLIAALDVPDRGAADVLIERLGGAPDFVKIGLELFIAAGPDLVRDYALRGYRVMLDLKLHDIPATVGRATAQAASLGAELLTIHTAGGRAMMQAAVEAARAAPGERRTRILAVTVLTSMDDRDVAEVGAAEGVERLVLRRAQLAMEAGCDGVVASPHEAARLREGAPADFLIVTPGVRPGGTDAGDQKRVMTPARARQAGATMIVVGRPIRDAADPAGVCRDLVAELAGA
jgi:orotidine-5'-phosphate decarboxylase